MANDICNSTPMVSIKKWTAVNKNNDLDTGFWNRCFFHIFFCKMVALPFMQRGKNVQFKFVWKFMNTFWNQIMFAVLSLSVWMQLVFHFSRTVSQWTRNRRFCWTTQKTWVISCPSSTTLVTMDQVCPECVRSYLFIFLNIQC